MKLNETLIVKLPSSASTPKAVKDYPVSEVTVVTVMDDFVNKRIVARLKNFPFPVVLWDKTAYDTEAASWTNVTAQARAEVLCPNAAALKALIPKAFADLNK